MIDSMLAKHGMTADQKPIGIISPAQMVSGEIMEPKAKRAIRNRFFVTYIENDTKLLFETHFDTKPDLRTWLKTARGITLQTVVFGRKQEVEQRIDVVFV